MAQLGYEFKLELPGDPAYKEAYFGCCLFGNDIIGTWVNLWQCAPHTKATFNRYQVGLHHLAFHVSTKEELEAAFNWVKANKLCSILVAPKNYPEYGPNYRSFFFTECNGIKLEVVTMEEGE